MNRFPFPGYSYDYYKYYPKYTTRNTLSTKNTTTNTNEVKNDTPKKSPKSSPFTFNFDGFTSNDEAIVTLFGIKLYLDDLIIIGLLYLLYQEKVKDDMLFVCLLLLLLS